MGSQLPVVFDPMQVAPSTGGSGQLPISDSKGHEVCIVNADYVATKDNTGSMLALTFEIQSGPYQGATGVERLNIGHSNPDTVRIAYSQLSTICRLVGYTQALQDVSVLYRKPLRVVVGLQKGKDAVEKGYTEITQYLDIHGRKVNELDKPIPTAAPGAQMPGMPSPGAPAPGMPQQFAPPQQQAPQAGFPQQMPQQGFPQQTPPPQMPQQMPQQTPQQMQMPQQPPQMPQQFAPPQQQAPQAGFPQQMPQQASPQQPPWGQPPR